MTLEYGAIVMAEVSRHARSVAALMVQLDRLKLQMLGGGAVFLLPREMMPGITSIYGVRVLRGDVEAPMVAIPGALGSLS